MNRLTLAVAGGRKTQSIAEACATGPAGLRRLALTYTVNGQNELDARLRRHCQPGQSPEVMGWYTFLLRHWIRPYLPLLFAGLRLTGLNFDGDPGRFSQGPRRFLDSEGRAYRRHLAALAVQVADRAGGAVTDRLSRIYHEIYLDEVQDLTGRDLDILERIMDSPIILTMVGDLRQSVYDTNPHDPRHKQYRGLNMLQWFRAKEGEGKLAITHAARTWRSNQQIANFADRIFQHGLFAPTESTQNEVTGHDGVFVVSKTDLGAYLDRYDPLCLRASTATKIDLDRTSSVRSIQNFGKARGSQPSGYLSSPRSPFVRFWPTGHGSQTSRHAACTWRSPGHDTASHSSSTTFAESNCLSGHPPTESTTLSTVHRFCRPLCEDLSWPA